MLEFRKIDQSQEILVKPCYKIFKTFNIYFFPLIIVFNVIVCLILASLIS